MKNWQEASVSSFSTLIVQWQKETWGWTVCLCHVSLCQAFHWQLCKCFQFTKTQHHTVTTWWEVHFLCTRLFLIDWLSRLLLLLLLLLTVGQSSALRQVEGGMRKHGCFLCVSDGPEVAATARLSAHSDITPCCQRGKTLTLSHSICRRDFVMSVCILPGKNFFCVSLPSRMRNGMRTFSKFGAAQNKSRGK